VKREDKAGVLTETATENMSWTLSLSLAPSLSKRGEVSGEQASPVLYNNQP
jgi:hypothetical protein